MYLKMQAESEWMQLGVRDEVARPERKVVVYSLLTDQSVGRPAGSSVEFE
jgi:hypothetical protein